MTKSVISHENNSALQDLSITKAQETIVGNYKPSNIGSYNSKMLDPSTTPFLNSWKSATLAQSRLIGMLSEPSERFDFKVISDKIEKSLLQPGNRVENLQHIVDTSSNFGEVLTAQEQLYLKKAAFYNINLNDDQWCELTDLHMYDAVDGWEKLLKQALCLGVDWKISDYDPQGLELAVEEQEELCAIDAREERRQANSYYYSTRGC